MNISVEKLAKLANERLLPVPLEQLWEERTGVNPVIQANLYEKMRIRFMNFKVYGGFGVVLLLPLLVGIVLMTIYASEPIFILGPDAPSAVSFAATLVLSIGATTTIMSFLLGGFSGLPIKTEAEAYGVALGAFVEWSGCDINVLCQFEFGRNRLKKEATKILTQHARRVLVLELGGDEHDPEFVTEKDELLRGMRDKSNILVKLSLVPEGKYDRYFRLAQKKIDAEAKESAEEAEAA